MYLNLFVDSDNDAMTIEELQKILEHFKGLLTNGSGHSAILDTNGNRVGTLVLKEES